MSKCVVKRDRKENRRLLAGIGIPLVGGFLLLLLSRWLNIHGAGSDVFAYVVIMLLAGAGSFLIARGFAIVMTPLLVLGGFLLSSILQGAYLDLLVEWIQRFSPLFLSVALVGATLGVGMAKLGVRAQRTMGGLIPAPSVPSSSPAEASNPQAGQPEQDEGKQDDIARVLAQMQHEYAQAKSQEPNDGTQQTL